MGSIASFCQAARSQRTDLSHAAAGGHNPTQLLVLSTMETHKENSSRRRLRYCFLGFMVLK